MEAEGTTTIACFDESKPEKHFPRQEPSKSHHSNDSASAHAGSLANACFDCSICLDFAVDPVVTLCGHLYCWPCIYKWMQVENTTPQQCPVCKSPLSQNTLVPLYSRGSTKPRTKTEGLDIPSRPAVLRDVIASSAANNDGLHPPMQQHHHHHYYPLQLGTAGGVLGGLAIAILPLVTRNNQNAGEMYMSRLNHLMPSATSASQRMQERRVEDSLHQIWMFLFCCAVLGLLFF